MHAGTPLFKHLEVFLSSEPFFNIFFYQPSCTFPPSSLLIILPAGVTVLCPLVSHPPLLPGGHVHPAQKHGLPPGSCHLTQGRPLGAVALRLLAPCLLHPPGSLLAAPSSLHLAQPPSAPSSTSRETPTTVAPIRTPSVSGLPRHTYSVLAAIWGLSLRQAHQAEEGHNAD